MPPPRPPSVQARASNQPKPGRRYGSFPRATAEGQEYADFLTSPPPVRLGFCRTGLLFTCQPSGEQAFIQGGWPLAKVKSDGTFGGKAGVVQAPPLDPLFENATSGTETWSGRFTSSTTGTLTLKVTGMGVSGFAPVGGGDFMTTPSTCNAGPKTFRIRLISGRARRSAADEDTASRLTRLKTMRRAGVRLVNGAPARSRCSPRP